jgi:hypothetical protein
MEAHEECGQYHPITDVFCEKRRRFLVRYPQPLIIGIGAAGLLGFLLVGYLGYNRVLDCGAGVANCWQHAGFDKPWPLYVWFCILMVALQVSILRNPRLRPQLVAILVVTLISAVTMYWLTFYGPLQQIYDNLLHLKFGFLRTLFSDQWTFTILNFFVIVIFFADTVLRWWRRARGITPDGSLAGVAASKADDPRIEELATGDFIAGMVLFGLMAVIFTYDFIRGAAALLPIAPDPAHPVGADIASVPQQIPLLGGVALSQIDRLLALVCLPLGFIVLAFSATVWGLTAVRAVVNLAPRTVAAADSTTGSVTSQVALVLANAVRSALDRYLRFVLFRILSSLRNVLWIILIFVANIGLAALAWLVQQYLHNSPRPIGVIIGAALAAGVSVLSVTLSVALLLNSRRVASNALRLLYWVGFVLLLTFWLFSTAMAGLDWLGQVAGFIPPGLSPASGRASCPRPFLHNLWNPQLPGCNQPFAVSYLTFISVAFLLGLLVWLQVRQVLARGTAAAPVGASSPRGASAPPER